MWQVLILRPTGKTLRVEMRRMWRFDDRNNIQYQWSQVTLYFHLIHIVHFYTCLVPRGFCHAVTCPSTEDNYFWQNAKWVISKFFKLDKNALETADSYEAFNHHFQKSPCWEIFRHYITSDHQFTVVDGESQRVRGPDGIRPGLLTIGERGKQSPYLLDCHKATISSN